MVYVCLSLILLVLVYAHGPSKQALGDPVWTSAIISGFLVMGPLATLTYTLTRSHTFTHTHTHANNICHSRVEVKF